MDPKLQVRGRQRAGGFLQPRRRGHDDARGRRQPGVPRRAARANWRGNAWQQSARPLPTPSPRIAGSSSGARCGAHGPNSATSPAPASCSTSQSDWVEQMRAAARARYASGEGTQLDLLRAGLDVAMLREQQLDLERDAGDAPCPARPLDRRRRGRQRRAVLAAGAQRSRAARHARGASAAPPGASWTSSGASRLRNTGVDLAKQRYKPGWMLDLSYGLRSGSMDGESRPDMLSAMVTVDLPLFRANRQDREVAAARAEARGLHEMHDDHQREMRAMLAEAWNDRRPHRRARALLRDASSSRSPSSRCRRRCSPIASNRVMVDEVIDGPPRRARDLAQAPAAGRGPLAGPVRRRLPRRRRRNEE